MNFSEKTAVVTGGSRGLGRAICLELARGGANVVFCYAGNEAAANETAAACESLGAKAVALRCDVSKEDEVKALMDAALKTFGRIDILVNNAGITRDAMTRKMSDELWDLVIDVDLKGLFNLTRYIGPQMEDKGSGAIVNISSVVGEYGNIGQANYAAAKAGVIGLTKTWAKEFARKGAAVRVNCIAPGYTMTDMLKTVPQDLLDKFADMTMLKRLGRPEEIASAALFLVSEEASYVTGQVLSVNGGMRL